MKLLILLSVSKKCTLHAQSGVVLHSACAERSGVCGGRGGGGHSVCIRAGGCDCLCVRENLCVRDRGEGEGGEGGGEESVC